jgi:hypothetical protein
MRLWTIIGLVCEVTGIFKMLVCVLEDILGVLYVSPGSR